MKATISVSIEEQDLKVIYAIMERRGVSRSEAICFLIRQGTARLRELHEGEDSEAQE